MSLLPHLIAAQKLLSTPPSPPASLSPEGQLLGSWGPAGVGLRCTGIVQASDNTLTATSPLRLMGAAGQQTEVKGQWEVGQVIGGCNPGSGRGSEYQGSSQSRES